MNLFTKQKQTHKENKLWLPKGKGNGRGINYKFGISRKKLVYIKQLNNKVLLYSTGNYFQYSVIKHNGKEYVCVCVYILNCLAMYQKLTQHCKSTILQ